MAREAHAQYGPSHWPYYGGGGSGPGSGSGTSGDSNGFGFGSFEGAPGFDVDAAMRTRTIHGILAALAMVVLFPSGSILMRILPGRLALWGHALTQVIAFCVYIAAAGLGFYLVHEVQIPFAGGSLLENPATSYHPVIGIVVLVFLFFQPFLGLIHHAKFKRLQRRTAWSYLHIFNGRIFITLGIINGGLGLGLAGADAGVKKTYIVVSVIMWTLWMAAAIIGEVRRCNANRKVAREGRRQRKMSDGEVPF
ncbi:hypothetical protein QBC46DRAFT_26102 [Diplogelasinospora grovesii]|uniref:Cytochrome b561 domain-containing protein n=1 Tax=Diplogelasinospora grovesii TaxID=303347 RepID=A0AAN6N392_9PEZI|nr:hypothetical protein QBC46DRAFT_26102 [Diplogelasinospora grovesii]